MKPRSLLVLLASLAMPLALFADPVPGALSNVTLAFNRAATQVVSESATKLLKVSYGNKDLLLELLEAGILGEGETRIKGWRIVAVDFFPLQEHEEHFIAFYAVKAGRTPVLIPLSRLRVDIESEAVATGSTVKPAGAGLSEKTSFKRVVEIDGQQVSAGGPDSAPYDFSYELVGIATGNTQTAARTLKVDGTPFPYTFDLITKLSIKPAVGIAADNLVEDSRTPIEGSISFSAFKAADISGFPFLL